MDKRKQRIKYLLSDFLTASLTWILFNLLRYDYIAHYDFSSLKDYLLSYQVLQGQILIPFSWLFIYFLSGYYNNPFGRSRIGEFFNTLIIVTVGTVIIFFTVILNDLPQSFDLYYKLFFSLMIMQFFFTYAARLFITSRALKKIWNHEWYKGIIIIGAGEKAKKLQYELSGSEYKIIGFVNESVSEKSIIEEAKIIGNIKDLPGIIKDNNIDEIIVATESEDTVKLLYSLYHFRRPIKILIEKNDLLSKVKIKNVYDIPLIDVTENNFSEAERNVKWLIDKIISFFVLIICLPLYIYISLRVKKDSKGPVFFSQERIGFHGKPFRIYKFRTMYVDAENQGALLTAKDDIRVTRFGRFLRKYRLDEMPQFWNVLKGDMSLVGPRPEQRYYIKQIVQKAPYYYLLHNVRPGITSLGMVKYGYAESVDKMIERLDYDVLYYENMSLAMDLTILVYTIKTVFTGKGI